MPPFVLLGEEEGEEVGEGGMGNWVSTSVVCVLIGELSRGVSFLNHNILSGKWEEHDLCDRLTCFNPFCFLMFCT